VSTTSAKALQELAATDEQLHIAEAAYDHALVVGTDADVAEAEAALAILRRTRLRLERQSAVLKDTELADRRAREQQTKEDAQADLARCRDQARDAIASFMTTFREHVAELHEMAQTQLGEPLRALNAARALNDQLHGQSPAFVPKEMAVLNGYPAASDMLTEMMRTHFGGEPSLAEVEKEFIVLGFVEDFARRVGHDVPPAAA
jgi:hypothetical protein